jgi:hypothetical protein
MRYPTPARLNDFNRSGGKFIMVQEFDWLQMRVSGFNSQFEFVLGAGAKAKTLSDWRQPGKRDNRVSRSFSGG